MSNGSCTAVLDVFRIDGTKVSNADKARQGSIVNIYNPYRVDYEEFPDPPNNRIEIELTWTAGPSGSVATLEENGPRLGKGTIAIFDDDVLLKPTDHQTIKDRDDKDDKGQASFGPSQMPRDLCLSFSRFPVFCPFPVFCHIHRL